MDVIKEKLTPKSNKPNRQEGNAKASSSSSRSLQEELTPILNELEKERLVLLKDRNSIFFWFRLLGALLVIGFFFVIVILPFSGGSGLDLWSNIAGYFLIVFGNLPPLYHLLWAQKLIRRSLDPALNHEYKLGSVSAKIDKLFTSISDVPFHLGILFYKIMAPFFINFARNILLVLSIAVVVAMVTVVSLVNESLGWSAAFKVIVGMLIMGIVGVWRLTRKGKEK